MHQDDIIKFVCKKCGKEVEEKNPYLFGGTSPRGARRHSGICSTCIKNTRIRRKNPYR